MIETILALVASFLVFALGKINGHRAERRMLAKTYRDMPRAQRRAAMSGVRKRKRRR